MEQETADGKAGVQGREVERLLPSAAPASPWQGSWQGPQGCRPPAWSPAQLWGFLVKPTQGDILAGGLPLPHRLRCCPAVSLSIPEASVSPVALRSSAGEHLRVRKVGAHSPPFTVPVLSSPGGEGLPQEDSAAQRGVGDLLSDAQLVRVGWGLSRPPNLCQVRGPPSFAPR